MNTHNTHLPLNILAIFRDNKPGNLETGMFGPISRDTHPFESHSSRMIGFSFKDMNELHEFICYG